MYPIYKLIFKLISHIPFGVLYAISDVMYFFMYYVVRYRRKIVRRNIAESFPDLDKEEIADIEKRFYRFFCDVLLESVKLYSMSPKEIGRRIKFTNVDEVNAWLKQGHSVALYLGHFGNWEWVASLALWLDKNAVSAQVYHKLDNEAFDRLMIEVREKCGSKCVEMSQTARFVNAAYTSGVPHIIGFIADHSPKRRDSKFFLNFLNHEVPVITGTERLAKHYHYKAAFLNVKRVRRGYYECEFSTLHDDPSHLPDFELTALYFRKLEQEIRRQPEIYLWTHNRFKYAILNQD